MSLESALVGDEAYKFENEKNLLKFVTFTFTYLYFPFT